MTFMIISGVLCIVLARYTYSPVQELISQLATKTGIQNEKNSELDFINYVVDHTLQEKMTLAGKLTDSAGIIVDNMLIKSLQGLLPQDFKLSEMLRNYRINIKNTNFTVAILQFAPSTDVSSEKQSFSSDVHTGNILESILYDHNPDNLLFFVAGISSNRYAVICNHEDFSEGYRSFKEQCVFLQKEAQEYFSTECSLAVSNPHSGIEHLHSAYIQAQQTLEYVDIDKQILLYYEDIEQRSFHYQYNYLKKGELQLEKYICSSSKENMASNLYQEIKNACFTESQASLEVFQCFRYDMINLLARIIEKNFPVSFERDYHVIDGLLNTASFVKFESEIIPAIELLKESYSADQSYSQLVTDVLEFLNTNYSDVNLNLNYLSHQFNISPSYLSKQVKEQTGDSPLDILSSIRLTHAAELLKTSTQTIDEVAQSCGYLSSTVFIRNFKKKENITPGEYRKLHQVQ